jgi:hypothetical protein
MFYSKLGEIKNENVTKFYSEKLNGTDRLEDLGVGIDGRIILK